MQSTDYRGELPILASPRRAMERRPCGPRPSTPASAGRPTAAIHTDPRSKDKSWADGIGQPGKLGGRVRSLAYLRLKAAVASALGAGPAAPAGVHSPGGCGSERLGSGPAALMSPAQRAAPATAPLLRCASRPSARNGVYAPRAHVAWRIRPVGRSAQRNKGGGRRPCDFRGAEKHEAESLIANRYSRRRQKQGSGKSL